MKSVFSILAACIVAFAGITVSTAAIVDNFSDGDFTNNPAWTTNAGIWSAASTVLRQTDTFGSFTLAPHRIITLNGFSTTNPYDVSADMGIIGGEGNNSVGIAFHVQNPSNFYAFVIFPGYPGGALRLLKIAGGTASTLVFDTAMTAGTPASGSSAFHHMEVDVIGTNFTVKVNGLTTLSQPYYYSNTFSDVTFSGGGVGLLSQGGVGFFDNFVVPEPGSMALIMMGGVALLRRRKS